MRALTDTRWAVAQFSGLVARDARRRLFAGLAQRCNGTGPCRNGGAGFGQGLAAAPGPNEIRIGNTAPYTGPASAYGVIAKASQRIWTRPTPKAGSTAARSI